MYNEGRLYPMVGKVDPHFLFIVLCYASVISGSLCQVKGFLGESIFWWYCLVLMGWTYCIVVLVDERCWNPYSFIERSGACLMGSIVVMACAS